MNCYKVHSRPLSKFTAASNNRTKTVSSETKSKTASSDTRTKMATTKMATTKTANAKTANAKTANAKTAKTANAKTANAKTANAKTAKTAKKNDDSGSDSEIDTSNVVSIGTPEYDISITPHNTPSPSKQDKTCNSPCFKMQVSSNTPFTLKLYYRK
jgi:hypothetical protein